MLMVVSIDSWIDLRPPALGVFTRIHSVCVEDAGKFDLKLNGAILMKHPVHAIFVVCSSEDMRNDKFAASRDYDRVVSEVCVLE